MDGGLQVKYQKSELTTFSGECFHRDSFYKSTQRSEGRSGVGHVQKE